MSNSLHLLLPRRSCPLMLIMLLSAISCVSFAAQTAHADLVLPLTASNVPCVGGAPEQMRDLHTESDRQARGFFSIKTHSCNGGLYFAANNSEPIWILHEGWWLKELAAVYWLDLDTLRIGASFYTGAGPDAASPFNAELTLSRRVNGWSLQGPELLQREFDLPQQFALHGVRGHAFQVDTAEQLGSLRSKLQVAVDFSEQRLWIVPIMLNSGSIRIEEVKVKATHNQYVLSWKATSPFIATADMNPTLIWVVVPKDHRTLTLKNDFPAAPCNLCTGGSQHHTQVAYRSQGNQSIWNGRQPVKTK